jgi:hypothetical protein
MSIEGKSVVTETYCRYMGSKGKGTELCMASSAR